ncbi:ATP-grasp domain-containing protein [Bacillus sp. B15-48]|uniref:ATP-grasp domain-containing protein n=1 Tax=Bacillus sp. B15-48 TaxID=1548601 RepID=UPI00193F97D7|nr:ATP-grasp domain-containing protein [Bacillus sp. B15-48]MBM4762207.1 ATP-grasp domain-containing protein [Bacillus sp. B15-48]
MDTIVFIGSNKSGTSREAIQTAEKMGYFTVLFTDRDKFLQQREEFPDVHQMIYLENLFDERNLINQLNRLTLQGKTLKACISLVDPYVSLAAVVAAEMGLFQLSIEALYKMENKICFRKELQSLNVNPSFTTLLSHENLQDKMNQFTHSYPLIIKSPQSNGSKDVLYVNNRSELEAGIAILKTENEDMPILIEEYLEGPQYLVEVIVWEGKVHLVGIVEQVISLGERFIVSGYHFPAMIAEHLLTELQITVEKIVNILEMEYGSCHLELRLVQGKWKLVEINPRVSGGAMNQILFEGSGMSLVQEVIKLYLGEKPEVIITEHRHVFAQFITVNSKGLLLKVTGKNRALAYEGVKDVYIKPRKGAILKPPHSMGDRYAYVIASADTFEDAQKIAITAAKEIKFYMEPL